MRFIVPVLVSSIAIAAGCAGAAPTEVSEGSGDGGSSGSSSTSSSSGGSTSSTSSSSGGSTSSTSSSGGEKDAGADTGAPDEFDTPSVCTNGMSNAGNGSQMKPGETCLSCHANQFSIGGTVYPTGHEPNDCKGVTGGATIQVTDSKNKTTQVTVNSAGNFYSSSNFSFPLQVKVVSGGKERVMTTPITAAMTGNCNKCHTETGGGNPAAPGRILIPK